MKRPAETQDPPRCVWCGAAIVKPVAGRPHVCDKCAAAGR